MDLATAIALADELTPGPADAHAALRVLRDAYQHERQEHLDATKTYASLLWLISDIRAALGVAGKPMLSELPGLIYAEHAELQTMRAAVRKTLDDNAHLADGDACTLIDLKQALQGRDQTDFDMLLDAGVERAGTGCSD